MRELIQKVLDHCGYEGEPTEELLIECFLDYVDSGVFGNLDYDEAKNLIEDGEISVKTMCSNLLKVR
jgi:hypothetical protein